jgi:hypothetical protein
MPECELDSSGSGSGPVAGSSEHIKKLWEFREWLRKYWILKKGSAPWSYLIN